MSVQPPQIVGFWREAGPKAWFAKNAAFDAEIASRFEASHHAAARGEHDAWANTAQGALALLLLFDQFPRNLWRGSAHAFATDPVARLTARRAITLGHDMATEASLRRFFYLPFSHSEHLADQDAGMALWATLEKQTGESAKWAHLHRNIIARFGRFPHRNRFLGRETTDEEQTFLEGGGFSG